MAPFKLVDGIKRPATSHSFRDATTDQGKLAGWRADPQNTIWVTPTGRDTGIVVVDVDNKNGKDGSMVLMELADRGHYMPQTVMAETMSGGWHYYYSYPVGVHKVRSGSDVLGAGVDIRGDGGCIAVAGLSAGYRWIISPQAARLAPLPDWILAQCAVDESPVVVAPCAATAGDIATATRALEYVNPDCDYETWVQVGMALHSIGAFDLWDGWSARGSKYQAGSCGRKWATFNGGGVSLGTLVHLAYDGGMPKPKPAEFAPLPPLDSYADEVNMVRRR